MHGRARSVDILKLLLRILLTHSLTDGGREARRSEGKKRTYKKQEERGSLERCVGQQEGSKWRRKGGETELGREVEEVHMQCKLL